MSGYWEATYWRASGLTDENSFPSTKSFIFSVLFPRYEVGFSEERIEFPVYIGELVAEIRQLPDIVFKGHLK